MLVGILVLMLLQALGIFGSDGIGRTILSFFGGPLVTATAALCYRYGARLVDAAAERGEHAIAAVLDARHALATAGLGIVAAIAGSYLLGLALDQFSLPVEEQQGILDITERMHEHGLTLEFSVLTFAALILAPLAEEWLFRGLLFRRLLGIGGKPEAFFLSAAAFAAIHTNPAGFVIYMWLGLVFAESYRRTGRLWVAVLVHMGNNAFALSLLAFA